jgi:hypothetical protein
MPGMRHVLVLATLLLLTTAAPVSAWDCPDGVPDTWENQKAGICVEKPRHHKPKHPTPVPPTPIPPTPLPPTPVPPTPVPPTPVPPAPAKPTPTPAPLVVVPQSSPSHQAGQVCVWEVTTSQWEPRSHHGDTLEAGQRWPLERDLCEQDRPAAVTNTPVATATPYVPYVPVAEVVVVPVAPASTPETVQSACFWVPDLIPVLDDDGNHLYVGDLPAWLGPDGTVMVGELCPVKTDVPVEIEPIVPVQLPNTGDGSTWVPE